MEGKNEALANALQNKLDGVVVPVQFEDAIMTLSIVPQELVKDRAGIRPKRSVFQWKNPDFLFQES